MDRIERGFVNILALTHYLCFIMMVGEDYIDYVEEMKEDVLPEQNGDEYFERISREGMDD